MTDIREYLARKPLLFDGMGTYYKAAPGADCEMANLTDPEGVKRSCGISGRRCAGHQDQHLRSAPDGGGPDAGLGRAGRGGLEAGL